MILRKLGKVAEKAASSAVGLVFGVITIFIAVLIALFESFRPNWTRRKHARHRNRTSKSKVLAFWRTFKAPIHVPEHDREVSQLLISGNVAELVSVLERRASLGSGWASGLLGYLEAVGVLTGKPNLAAAISRCTAAAQAGNPYAQFVLAWALWETGKRVQGMRWMKRSGIDGKFLPGWASFGMMLYRLAGKSQNTRSIAVKVLWSAHRRGHIASLGVLCSAAYRGHFGHACRLLGFIAYPFVVLRTMLMSWWDPLSERSFIWYPRELHRLAPFLNSNRRAAASPSLDQGTPEDAVVPQPVPSKPESAGEGRVAACSDGHKAPEVSETTS